ncbi:MAG: hypothetical protein COV48_05815 [Elusimicrobia bacterium CG11_big_fil_rev_8_21_14_0_20_64_6]|nr:MAG: hypothetical protein COV48_05815 [Elusimicrobia bacterium CG11_big_fil_rev_8_21_14_0_20_64_6]
MNLGKHPREYRKMKERCPDEILLYQIGTFFKIMHEDARKVAGPLELKLFVAGEAEHPVPVCGFPKSGLDKYVGRLARAGFSVAVCRQRKDEGGGVHRDLIERIRLAAGHDIGGANAAERSRDNGSDEPGRLPTASGSGASERAIGEGMPLPESVGKAASPEGSVASPRDSARSETPPPFVVEERPGE